MILGLNPSDFDNIQDFFSQFNTIRLELSSCGIVKGDEQLILSILSKLGPDYSIFVSKFYSTMDAFGSAYKLLAWWICSTTHKGTSKVGTHGSTDAFHTTSIDCKWVHIKGF